MVQDVNGRDYVAIADEYCKRVLSGEIPAGRWIKLACQRQVEDLERAANGWRYRFDAEKAWRVCFFVEQLPHIEGRWKTRTVVLEPWQCFILTTIFGWVDVETDLRRFRKALIVIARKNGKTFLAAAIGLYLLAADGEPGAKVYSAATTRDQAKLSWSPARKMAEKTPGLCERFGVQISAHSIFVESNAAFFHPLSRDVDSLEGLNPHGAIIDELHAHKTREVFDVLDEATGARTQPLIFIISTEGDNATGVFAEQVTYGQITLESQPDDRDETYFCAYYAIDPADDWTDSNCWIKANPNIGISVSYENLDTRCRQAQVNAESQSSFLTKRMNVRVGAGDAYFNMLAWSTICKDTRLKIEDFYGWPCMIGLDLASTQDIAAKVYLFRDGRKAIAFGRYYIPGDNIARGKSNYDIYRGWVERGHLTVTEGRRIDYEFIERDLLDDRRNFDVRHIAFDKYNATQLSMRMAAEGLPMVEVGQSVMMLNEPMKELSDRIVAGSIKHNGDPVLTWMVGNVVAKKDAQDNVFPRKSRDENKIDGAISLIMATRMDMVEIEQFINYDGLPLVG